MGRLTGLLVLAVVGAVRATAAAASEEAPPPRPSERPEARRASDPVRATRAGLVLELRSDFGLERLVLVEFTNERRAAMNLNDGLGVALGVSFLPLAKGRLVTRATGGLKLARLRASNGTAMFTAFPVELMEAAYVGRVRVGAGLSLLLAPRVSADGILEQERISFAAAPGAVADVEWLLSARGRTGIGLRVGWNRFTWRGTSRGAPAIGVVIRADLDLAGGR